MKNKIWIFLGGAVITLFLFFGLPKTMAWAAEGECHLKHCLVPAPTILMPVDGDEVTTTRPEIRGLSWKTALVKVYIDGRELSNVQFRKHEDYYGSFFVVPDYDLTPGEHFIYTIAHSEKPGWYDQSKESIYIEINVKRIVVLARPAAVLPPVPQMTEPVSIVPEETVPADTAAVSDLPDEKLDDLFPDTNQEAGDLPPIDSSAELKENQEMAVDIASQNNPAEDFNVINSESEGDVNIAPGQIEGGVSVEQDSDSPQPTLQEAAGLSDLGELLQDEFEAKNIEEREKKNRLIGLSMLAVILVVTIIWLALDRKNKIRRGFGGSDEGILPPPPIPSKKYRQNQAAESVDEEITIEPIDEEDNELMADYSVDQPDKYWASPPPSPYSPYPSAVDIDKKNDRKNDLGL